jgi:predicted amidohydrolase
MGEKIMAPAHRRVAILDAFGLRIAVMICLDVVDYTTLAALMRAGDQVELVLVPCYTDRFEKMKDIAAVASKALPGVVALVNASLEDPGPRYIARCGKPLPVAQPPIAVEGGAEVALLSVRLDELHQKRTEAVIDPDPYLDWMFGNRYQPREHPQPI